MNSYELTAMQQQSIQGIQKLLKNTKVVTTYQSSVPIGTIKKMKEQGIITILHWEHSNKKGFQRVENEKHIMNIAKYIIQPNALTPQNIILSIRKDSFLKFSPKFAEVGILEVNEDSIITLLDGQHRISAFIRVIELIDNDIQGLTEYLDNGGIPYQINRIFVNEGYEKDTPQRTIKTLQQLQKQLIEYKISCNFIANLTEKQEIEIFLNLNTKGLHIDRGLADHLKIALGHAGSLKEFAYRYIDYIHKTPTNIFNDFLKAVNQKAVTGTITETSFARSIMKTHVVSKYVDTFGNKDYNSEETFNGFVKLMDEYWSALKDTMPEAFDISQQKTYSLIRSSGMESFNGLLARIIVNKKGLEANVPNFELSYGFFKTCFEMLKKQSMAYTKKESWMRGGFSAKSFGSSANKSLADDMWEAIKTAAFNRDLKISHKYSKKPRTKQLQKIGKVV